MNNPALTFLTALSLKVVGVILIISALLDYLVLPYPYQPLQQDWQITVTNMMVDRGIIPMMGIAILVVGYWVGSANSEEERISFTDLRLWSFLLASLLGLMFLLLIPLHLSNLGRARTDAMKQIEARSGQIETEIQNRRQQLLQVVQDNQRLAQIEDAIKTGQFQGNKLAPQDVKQLETIRDQIKQIRTDPKRLESEIDSWKTQLSTLKTSEEKRAKDNIFKTAFRIGASSFLLAIGYIVIGWTGFRGLLGAGPSSAGRRRLSVK